MWHDCGTFRTTERLEGAEALSRTTRSEVGFSFLRVEPTADFDTYSTGHGREWSSAAPCFEEPLTAL
jgi:hypothetical protein